MRGSVHAALRRRLADIYMSLPQHHSNNDAAGEATSRLLSELSAEIEANHPGLAFKIIQQNPPPKDPK